MDDRNNPYRRLVKDSKTKGYPTTYIQQRRANPCDVNERGFTYQFRKTPFIGCSNQLGSWGKCASVPGNQRKWRFDHAAVKWDCFVEGDPEFKYPMPAGFAKFAAWKQKPQVKKAALKWSTSDFYYPYDHKAYNIALTYLWNKGKHGGEGKGDPEEAAGELLKRHNELAMEGVRKLSGIVMPKREKKSPAPTPTPTPPATPPPRPTPPATPSPVSVRSPPPSATPRSSPAPSPTIKLTASDKYIDDLLEKLNDDDKETRRKARGIIERSANVEVWLAAYLNGEGNGVRALLKRPLEERVWGSEITKLSKPQRKDKATVMKHLGISDKDYEARKRLYAKLAGPVLLQDTPDVRRLYEVLKSKQPSDTKRGKEWTAARDEVKDKYDMDVPSFRSLVEAMKPAPKPKPKPAAVDLDAFYGKQGQDAFPRFFPSAAPGAHKKLVPYWDVLSQPKKDAADKDEWDKMNKSRFDVFGKSSGTLPEWRKTVHLYIEHLKRLPLPPNIDALVKDPKRTPEEAAFYRTMALAKRMGAPDKDYTP